MSTAQSVIGSHHFDGTAHEWFATTSGDVNPMHVDPILARRTLYGRCVVHGVHVAIAGLDSWCGSSALDDDDRFAIGAVTVEFVKPVFVDDEVEYSLGRLTATAARVRANGIGVDGGHDQDRTW